MSRERRLRAILSAAAGVNGLAMIGIASGEVLAVAGILLAASRGGSE